MSNTLRRTVSRLRSRPIRPMVRPTGLSRGLTAAALVLGLATSCAHRSGPGCPRLPKGATPDFVLHTTEGKALRLRAHLGQATFIVFFSSWCLPCQLLQQRLLRVQAAFGKDRVRILAVALDRDPTFVRQYALATHAPFPVLLGTAPALEAAGLPRIRVVPTTLVLDASGSIRARLVGVPTTRALARLVRCVLPRRR